MNNVTTAEDPTQAVLSESALSAKSLCDYVVNVATGCCHGCRFCYVPSTPQVRTRPEILAENAWLEAWRERESPEPFAGRNPPDEPLPDLPPARPAPTTLAAFGSEGGERA